MYCMYDLDEKQEQTKLRCVQRFIELMSYFLLSSGAELYCLTVCCVCVPY